MLSSSNRTLRLVETDLGKAWNWYFLQKEEYCASPGRLLIEGFAKQIKFSSQRSPPFFFFPMISANCSSCIFSASLSRALHFCYSLDVANISTGAWQQCFPLRMQQPCPATRLVVWEGVQLAELALMSSVLEMLERR